MTRSATWRERLSAAADKAGFGEAARQRVAARYPVTPPAGQWVVTGTRPLTANQHILHLLLSVFTAGLWIPVWIIRAHQGNEQRKWVPASGRDRSS